MGSLAVILEKKNSQGTGLSSALFNEVADQWTKQPFVDAKVFDKNTTDAYFSNACPPDYPEHVMSRVFYGADLACDCLGISSFDMQGDNKMNLG